MYKVPHQFNNNKAKSIGIIQKNLIYHGITASIIYIPLSFYITIFNGNEFNQTFSQRFIDHFIALSIFNIPLCLLIGSITGLVHKYFNRQSKSVTIWILLVTITAISTISLKWYPNTTSYNQFILSYINLSYMIPNVILLNFSQKNIDSAINPPTINL